MSRENKRFQTVNPTLKELLAGIFVWGILFGAVFIWFAQSRLSFFLSLLSGVFAAGGLAVHMFYFVEGALELPQEDASRHMVKGAAIRTAIIIALVLVFVKLKGNVLALFLGLLTLKLGAYTQPLMHKIFQKIFRKEEGR